MYANCLGQIEAVLLELDKLHAENNFELEDWPELTIRKVVEVMKRYYLQNTPFNDRLISAFHDVAVVSFRNFENTSLGAAMDQLGDCLYSSIANYADYKPLGMDFGKGDPF